MVERARYREQQRGVPSQPVRAVPALARLAFMTAALVWAPPGTASDAAAASTPVFTDAALEARVMALAGELRCLVCQNQTIADSNAGLALDLRQQIRQMLQAGRTEAEVFDYMTQRYGDFVLYRPPVKSTTALLWAGPGLLLAGGLFGLWRVLRRRQALGDDAFDDAVASEGDDDAQWAASDPFLRSRTGAERSSDSDSASTHR